MTVATRMTAEGSVVLGDDDWRLYLTDQTGTSTDGTPLGTWWATDGATDADRKLIAYAPEPGGAAVYAVSWVPEAIQQLDGADLVGIPVDIAYSGTVVTVADLTGAATADGGDDFFPTWPGGLISLPLESLDDLLVAALGTIDGGTL